MTAIVETKTQRRRRTYRRNKKIRRAQSMRVFVINPNPYWDEYLVRGERDHIVKVQFDKVNCDCKNTASPCSHVIAVRIFRREWNEK